MAETSNGMPDANEARCLLDRAQMVSALEARCQELRAMREQKRQQRIHLAAVAEETARQLEALDREIVGIEGHGAEAEQWLSLVRAAQPLHLPEQNKTHEQQQGEQFGVSNSAS
jgi:hypothetical protein